MLARDQNRIGEILRQRQAELQSQSQQTADDRKPVILDQQSVGRLSRQDALQQQAMANAQDVRRVAELRRIEATLRRLGEGEFGFCEECGDDIPIKRLEIDPTTIYCVKCKNSIS